MKNVPIYRGAAYAASVTAICSILLTQAGASAANETTPIRMVVGAPVQAYGNTFVSDSGYIGGKTFSTPAPISGTNNDALYQRERYDVSGYRLPVKTNGAFKVKIRMAEIYFDGPGQRVFDVKSEGRTVASNLDIFARAGAKNRAYQLEFNSNVTDGVLDLRFVNKVNFAKIASLEVIAVPPTTSTTVPVATTAVPPTTIPKPIVTTTIKAPTSTIVVAPSTTSAPPTTLRAAPVTTTTSPVTKDVTPAPTALPFGAYVQAGSRPGPENTGIRSTAALRRHEGNLTITAPGTYENLDIHGFVNVKAPNVTLRNSIFRGGVATTNATPLVSNLGGYANLLIEDSTFVPEFPSYYLEGFKGFNSTLRRVDISGSVDGIGVHGDNFRLEQSWIHDLAYYSPYPVMSDNQTHNDGLQIHLGRNIRIVGNTIEGAHNAALMITPNTGVVADLHFNGNYANNGGCSVNVSEKGRGAIAGLRIDDNRFGRQTRIADCAILMPAATGAITEALRNVWEDSGTSVRVRRNG